MKRITCFAAVAVALGFFHYAAGHSELGGRAPARTGSDSPRMASKVAEPAGKLGTAPVLGRLICTDPVPQNDVASGANVRIAFEPYDQVNVNRILFVATTDIALVTAPPWSTAIRVPIDFVGTLKAAAHVFQDAGIAQGGTANELTLHVRAPAPLVGIEISPEVLYVFDYVPGKYCSFRVVGVYADGIKRLLNPVDFPLKAETENEDVAKVDVFRHPKMKTETRIVRGVAFGTTRVTVSEGQFKASAKVVYSSQ